MSTSAAQTRAAGRTRRALRGEARRHRRAVVTALAFLGLPAAHADITFSALHEGRWTVFHQETLDAAPAVVAGHVQGDQSSPRLSPDGRLVAFEVPGSGIQVCRLHASSSCELVDYGNEPPTRFAWTPHGELVFVQFTTSGSHEDSDLHTTRDGRKSAEILLRQTGVQDYPDLSPAGRYLAYSSGQTIAQHRGGIQVVQHLWVLDLGTGVARPLAPGPARDITPAWSPDGERIAFASNRDGQFEIWVIERSGGDPRKVTGGNGAKTWPTWSPDGRRLLHGRVEDGRQTLWIIDVDGANARRHEPFGPRSRVELRDPAWR